MGFMDKAREAAERATAKAQEGLAQGQTKLDEFQAKRDGEALYRQLGELFYAEQRTGGDHDAVVAKLVEIDAWHHQQAAQQQAAPGASAAPGAAPGEAPPGAQAGDQAGGQAPPPQGQGGPAGSPGTPSANFTLDD